MKQNTQIIWKILSVLYFTCNHVRLKLNSEVKLFQRLKEF